MAGKPSRKAAAEVAALKEARTDLLGPEDFQVAGYLSVSGNGPLPDLVALNGEFALRPSEPADVTAIDGPPPVRITPTAPPPVTVVRDPEPQPDTLTGAIAGWIAEKAEAQHEAEQDFAAELYLNHFPDAVAAHYGLEIDAVWEALWDLEEEGFQQHGMDWLGKALLYPFSYALAGIAIAHRVTGLAAETLPEPLRITIH